MDQPKYFMRFMFHHHNGGWAFPGNFRSRLLIIDDVPPIEAKISCLEIVLHT